jgi:hypothetical protein
MSTQYQIGRLVLSSRNTYKVNGKLAKQCLILSETIDNVLINTSKEFNPVDNYVLVDINKKQLVDNYGEIGNKCDDLNVYHYLHTYFWKSNSKLYSNLKNWNMCYDICKSRELYTNLVTTIDPQGSIDLDDGFTLNFSSDIVELDIHISDPTSYFDLSKTDTWIILEEMISRISTCYIPLNNKINHLLPEINIGNTNLLKQSTLAGINKRAITFSFKINLITKQVDFIIRKTLLTNIHNTTYEQYDSTINSDIKYKNKLITLCNFMITHLNCSVDTFDIETKTDISHKLIETFMIWTNYYAGNYLYNNKNKMMVRTQGKFVGFDKSVPEYAKTFMNTGAKYEFVNGELITDITDAKYTHHSLGIKNYCHVTSPMRRLIDMINHLILHDIDTNGELYDKLVKLIDVGKINSKLKIYKKLSNAYDIISHLRINNKFRACVFDICKSNIALMVLHDEYNKFKKIIKVEIPIEYCDELKQFDEFNVELFYDSYKFKSKSLPFSIKIIE